MSDPKNAKRPGQKLDAASAQKLRQQLVNKIAELSDEELGLVAGGTLSDVASATVGSSAFTSTCPSPNVPTPTAVSCD